MPRRSYDTDEITLRTIYARGSNNITIPSFRVLTSDGTGSTYWAIPSTLGYNPSFNQIITDAATFTADLSYNRLRLNQGTGIGFSAGGLSNQLYIYAKAFGQIDVSGNNSIPAFTNNVLNPNLKFAGTGGLTIRSDSTTNTILFDAHGIPISSSLYSFQQIKALSNTSTVNYNISSLNTYTILNASSYSSIMTLVGLGLVNLTTDTMNNAVYIGLSNASTISTSAIITSSITATLINAPSINTRFFSTGTVNTSSIQFVDTQTAAKQLLSVKNSILQLNGAPITGGGGVTQITAGTGISLSPAGGTGIVQITATNTGTVTSDNLVSTVTGLGTIGYLSSTKQNSFSTGILYTSSINFVDGCNNFIYPMTVSSGSLLFNGFNFSGGQGGGSVGQLIAGTGISLTPTSGQGATVRIDASVDFSASLTSTVIGLGTVGYVSTAALTNLVSTANLVNIVSTTYLTSQLTSTVVGLGTVGYVSTSQLTSTSKGLYDQIQSGGITNANLVSTVVGLGTVGYVSTAALTNLVSTANLVNIVSTTYLTSQLTSTVVGLGTVGYVSTSQLTSTSKGLYDQIQSGGITNANLVSTVVGLGTVGYVSTSQLTSTSKGLYDQIQSGGITNANLVSTVVGLGTVGYVSTSQLTSTSKGLYDQIQSGGITSDNLVSTVVGLGTVGYVSTSQLTSTSKGLYDQIQSGGITNANLVSTVVGLGTVGYVSTAALFNLVSTANLISLVSTANLISLVSTANLVNLVSTANLISLVSTANLINLVSTANLINLVSTSYLQNGIEFSSLSNESGRLNFSSLFVNNTPILFDQYGNLSLSFQTL